MEHASTAFLGTPRPGAARPAQETDRREVMAVVQGDSEWRPGQAAGLLPFLEKAVPLAAAECAA